jgi:hypothetical protein
LRQAVRIVAAIVMGMFVLISGFSSGMFCLSVHMALRATKGDESPAWAEDLF